MAQLQPQQTEREEKKHFKICVQLNVTRILFIAE